MHPYSVRLGAMSGQSSLAAHLNEPCLPLALDESRSIGLTIMRKMCMKSIKRIILQIIVCYNLRTSNDFCVNMLVCVSVSGIFFYKM